MWQAWINGIFGFWLIVSAFIVAGSKAACLVNNLTTGAVLIILGVWAALRHKYWQSWVVALVGAWMIVAGLVFPANFSGILANNILAGVLVVIAALWPGFSWALRIRKG